MRRFPRSHPVAKNRPAGAVRRLSVAVLLVGAARIVPPSEARAQAVDPPPKVARFLLDSTTAPRGGIASLVLSVEVFQPLETISVAINFDESKLLVDSVERIPTRFAPPVPNQEVIGQSVDNRNETPGDQADEGWVHLQLEASKLSKILTLAAGEITPVYQINFRVLPNAPEGFSPVELTNVGPVKVINESVLLVNAAKAQAADGAANEAVVLGPDDLVNGGVNIDIVGEVGFFVRGDVTMDRKRDISDPIRTLTFLFQGDKYLPCEDAADANDDGKIDLSDAVYSLHSLFMSQEPFPEPNQYGPDPTSDPLDCEGS